GVPGGAGLVHEAPGAYGLRWVLLASFPIKLVYTVRDDALHVVAVFHVRRRPGYWLDRIRRLAKPGDGGDVPKAWTSAPPSSMCMCCRRTALCRYCSGSPALSPAARRSGAAPRPRARGFTSALRGLGGRASPRHWLHSERAYLILAAISTPLVLSVHSVVSFDFAVSILPGWHTTIFPPYFVAGAIFSGFAMVLTLMLIARKAYGLEHLVTTRHIENMCKIILATGSMVGYAYGMEFFIAWYSGNMYERFAFINRATGPYAWAYWTMITCNVITPHLFWFKKVRTSPLLVWILAAVVNVGMWFERFFILVTSLHRDYIPSSWSYFRPTIWDMSLFAGTFGLFFTLFMLFIRVLPMVAMVEVKGVMPSAKPHEPHAEAAHG